MLLHATACSNAQCHPMEPAKARTSTSFDKRASTISGYVQAALCQVATAILGLTKSVGPPTSVISEHGRPVRVSCAKNTRTEASALQIGCDFSALRESC